VQATVAKAHRADRSLAAPALERAHLDWGRQVPKDIQKQMPEAVPAQEHNGPDMDMEVCQHCAQAGHSHYVVGERYWE
jgi:hypothetical protein